MLAANTLIAGSRIKNSLKKILTEVKEAIPPEIELSDVDIWFQDEARVGQRGTVTRLWTKTGTRPRAVRQLQYEYAYIYGAVCPAKDKGVALVLPAVNNEAMKLHLEEISKNITEGRHAVIVMDRAPWHTSLKVNIYKNITILPLPPASPELNPTEQVWQWLRDKDLANRCYSGYQDIVDACCNAWNKFCKGKDQIRNLCSRSWANIVNTIS